MKYFIFLFVLLLLSGCADTVTFLGAAEITPVGF